MQKQTIAFIGQLSEKEIADLKEKNKAGIYAISVGGHIAYFRNPTRQDINIAVSQLDQDNPMDYYEGLMRETYVGGSKALMEEDRLYLGAVSQVRKKAEGDKAVLVNL